MSHSNDAGSDELTDTANWTVWPTNAVCELSSRTNTGRSAVKHRPAIFRDVYDIFFVK